jgi:hypothetical protein
MESKKVNQNSFVIRIKRGEKIIESLAAFCNKEGIEGGFFYGVGAVDETELAHYDVGKQKYSSLKFDKPLELINITGSIGKEEELIIHAHAVLGDTDMQTIGGHLVEAKISGTAEIYLTKTEKLTKKKDSQTGLKLFSLS